MNNPLINKNNMQKHKLNKILLYIALSTTMLPSALAIPIYTTALGITGSGKGKLNKPDRIAADSQGKIYVSDSNNRVAIWNAQDNSWVGSFGSKGSGVGNFSLPSGIALNNRDKIYVVDDNNHRVTVWNAQDNSWVGSFGSEGSGDGKMKHPTGIALDGQGKIYVVDSENNRISIWNTQDNLWVGSFGSEGSGYGKLNRATGIALDRQGNIYVADSNNDRILIWNTQDNSWVGSFGSEGSGDGKMKHPTGIALDGQGNIYVADSENNRISIWNTQDNSWVGSFGSEGSGYGKLRHPNDIGVYQSMVYVTDYNNNRATIWFDPVLWKSAGTLILGTLNLNQDLKLDQDYNLQINKINDTTYNGGKSDGKLTITDKAVLTANAGSSINATSIVLDDATLILNTESISGNITYSAEGTLNINANITNNIDFAGKDGLLQLADSQTITGNVDSSTSSAGTLEFLGKGTVTGTIGGTNALSKLKFSGAGDITIPQGNAETIEVANKDTVITASKALTANILFSSNGRLISDKGITGNVDFAGKDGLLQLADSQTITGNVDSSTSSAGTLEFLGKGTVTGTIGGTNALSKLKFSGAGDITIPQGNAETIEVANKDTVITASKALTANILFSSNGRLISDKGITGNVDFAGKDGLLQLADSQTITGNVDSSTSSAGTLEFLGKGTVTGTIGGTNALSKLKFSGAGDITIPQGNAETIEVANKDTVITASKALTANILFSSNGRLISDKGITGNVDFAGKDGLLQLADSQTITGNVDSSTSSAGTLEFLGKGTVTGTIGGTNALSKLKFSGAGDITIPQGNAETIEVANKDTVITASKALTANILFSSNGRLISDKGITGNVDFAGKAAKLVFDGNISDDWYKLDGVISNASSAILEVATKLKVVDKGVGTIKTINIGQNGILSIKSNEDNLSLISSAGGSINLIDKDAQLVLSAAKNQTIKFNNNIKGADNGGGIILFDGNGSNLTITASDNVSLGTDDKKLGTINISGNVIFDKNVSTNASNLSIGSGGFLTNYSSTTSIDNINIGNSSGSGEYILDSRDEDLKISTGNIVYKNEDSILALTNTSEGEERTITLDASIVPSQDKYGILTLYSKGDKKFTIDNNNDNSITFGTKDYRLKGIKISSDDDAEIDIKPEINVESIGLDLNKIDLGQVDANIVFYKSTKYNANGDINGSIDFQGNKGVINVGDNVNISSTISSTGSSGEEITFLGSSTIGGVISNISTMRAGAGDITLQASGDYSIGELQGNGSGAITFPSGMNFTGGINRTGGNPLNLSFADSTHITGDIGSSSSTVGNISSGNNTQFNGDINSSGDIKTSGKTLFSGDVSCNNIIANRTSSSMLSLSLTTLTSAFNASSGNMLDFDESSVVTKFQGQVSTNGNIELNGSTYFASSVESQGNIVINGDTKFNKTLSNSNNIAISSNTNVIFNGNIKASSISIDNASVAISDDIEVQGNISTNNSTIILDNNKLTLSGTNSFSDHITISSTYDESSLSGGNIVLQSGSTLDLSNVSELTIKLAFINSDISKVNDDIKYNIILAEDGSKIVLLSNPEKNIKLDSSGEQNKFVKWTLDANSLTLYASDDSNNIIDNDYRFDSKQENDFMKELKESPPGSNGSEFKNNIGLLSKEQVEEMFSRILDHPKERSSDIVRVAVQQSLSNAHKTAIHAIHNRLGQSAVTVSAGEEDVSQYGVWLRTSINKSRDKVSSKRSEYFSSYKTRGHNHTIGFDGLVCDGLVVGGAYTRAYTNIRPQNQNIGNTDKVRTNMFSLYSAYNIPNYSWYLDSTLSYAESFIKNKELRNIAVSKNVLGTEIASSKYKSYLYSGSLSLGYIHNIGNNINIIPSLGALGSVIRDKGYAESGTSFQNLIVGKKSYNKLSGNVGVRISQHIYLDDIDNVILIPEIYGFANYNIKNKTPAIDARLSGINDRLPTISFRSNRIDYNIGLGVTIKQNMMEYGINYDANLAKKYQGHSGSIKVRVNL